MRKSHFRLSNLAFICLAGVIVLEIGVRILHKGASAIARYDLTEWLINYSTGFIRRGFTGSLLLWLHSIWKFDVNMVVTVFVYALFAFVTIYYCICAYRLRDRLPRHVLIILLFLPSSILMPILQPTEMGRKEILFFVLLIVHIAVFNHFTNRLNTRYREGHDPGPVVRQYTLVIFAVFNFLGILIALSHEAILIFSVPLNMVLTAIMLSQVHSIRRSSFVALLAYSPTIVVSVVIMLGPYVTVDEHTATAICSQFAFLERIDCPVGAFKFLVFSRQDALGYVYEENLAHGAVTATWIVLLGANLVLSVYCVSQCISQRLLYSANSIDQADAAQHRSWVFTFVILTFGIPFVASLPLYVVANDWGRWVTIINTSVLLCALGCNYHLLPESRVHHLFRIKDKVWHTLGFTGRGERAGKDNLLYGLVVLLAFYILSSTTLPHCCIRVDSIAETLTTGIVDECIRTLRLLVWIT